MSFFPFSLFIVVLFIGVSVLASCLLAEPLYCLLSTVFCSCSAIFSFTFFFKFISFFPFLSFPFLFVFLRTYPSLHNFIYFAFSFASLCSFSSLSFLFVSAFLLSPGYIDGFEADDVVFRRSERPDLHCADAVGSRRDGRE